MQDIIFQEAEANNRKVKVGILHYVGNGDPVKNLNAAVSKYVANEGYNEFVDANMDNPWVRVIVKGINEMDQVEFDPTVHHL